MVTETQQQFDFIKAVANQLAEKFIESLFELSNEKNYPTRIGGLAEILDWAKEFYDEYYDKITDREALLQGNHKLYKAETLNDLIIAFGTEKLTIFRSQNANHSTYFLEKYSDVIKENINEEFYYSQ
jgi:hypothetical protein